jgi:hypothetical protein
MPGPEQAPLATVDASEARLLLHHRLVQGGFRRTALHGMGCVKHRAGVFEFCVPTRITMARPKRKELVIELLTREITLLHSAHYGVASNVVGSPFVG